MSYRSHNLIVQADISIRRQYMAALAEHARSVPDNWTTNMAEWSLTLMSKDRARILKIDAHKVYTMDVRQPDGTYKSSQFNCKSIDEAWSMASQTLRIYKSKHAH